MFVLFDEKRNETDWEKGGVHYAFTRSPLLSVVLTNTYMFSYSKPPTHHKHVKRIKCRIHFVLPSEFDIHFGRLKWKWYYFS